MAIVIYGNLSMSELCEIFRETYSPRTIMRYTKELVESGKIEHGRIAKKGKRKRYFVKEENTKDNLLLQTVDWKDKNNWKHVGTPITQRHLSQYITETTHFYRKEELKEWKNFKKTKQMIYYVGYHTALIAECLRWISQLTWAIKSGMLGNSKTKLDLANRNKERYEEFLEKIVYNLNSRDEKIMKLVAKAMYHEIMNSLDYRSITMGKRKGKLIVELGKKTKSKTIT